MIKNEKFENITKSLEKVDAETLEGIYEDVYYKFSIIENGDTDIPQILGYCTEYVNIYPGELVPEGKFWPTEKQLLNYIQYLIDPKNILYPNKIFDKYIFTGLVKIGTDNDITDIITINKIDEYVSNLIS